MAHKICHFEIPADDVETLKKFYEKTFGWKIGPMPGTEGTEMGEYLMVDTGDKNLGGGMMKRQAPEHMPTMYIQVEDLDAHIRKVEEGGGKIIMGKMPVKGMGWFANFIDPQGGMFGLWQDDEKAE